LSEESFFVEVVHGKERAGAFAGGGREDGRIGQGESALVKKITHGADDLRAHPQDGGLARRAHPQVAVLHQEVGAVFFASNGKRVVLGNALHDFNVAHVKFVTPGGAFVGANFTDDDQA